MNGRKLFDPSEKISYNTGWNLLGGPVRDFHVVSLLP